MSTFYHRNELYKYAFFTIFINNYQIHCTRNAQNKFQIDMKKNTCSRQIDRSVGKTTLRLPLTAH